jgi:hypothetical protein
MILINTPQVIDVGGKVVCMVAVLTYVNKILLATEEWRLVLWNVMTGKSQHR